MMIPLENHTLTQSPGFRLIPKSIDNFRSWANESNTCLIDFAGELSILRQESVTFRTLIRQPTLLYSTEKTYPG